MFTTQNNTHKNNVRSTIALKAVAGLSACLLLSACGGGGSSSSASSDTGSELNAPAPVSETSISGAAVKGVISQGLVNAYAITNVGGRYTPSATPLTSAVRTNALGEYSLTLSGEYQDQAVLIEITADSLTTMTCDATSGCGVDESSNSIEFGDSFSLPDSFSLKSVVYGVDSGDRIDLPVSPLTSLVVASVEGEQTGFARENIEQAFTQIEALFGLDVGALNITPADITQLESYQSLTQAEIAMGVLSASFLALVDGEQYTNIAEVLSDLETSFASEEGITSVSSEEDNTLALDQVLSAASTVASDLASALPDSVHVQKINAVQSATDASYAELIAQNTDVQLAVITAQPQSAAVDEGESLLLSVQASGEDISYQWRKDGSVIQGQSGRTLSITDAGLADAGEYDVVISNLAGSVTSLSALLTVREIAPVEIVSSPSSVTVDEGLSAVFSVAVNGRGTISYQWRKDGVNLDGETSNTLSLNSVELADAGAYDVLVENEGGIVESVAASLSVIELPKSIQLSWDIPSQREDGQALELYEIDGYKIVYGTDELNLSSVLSVSGASETSVTVDELLSGTYYFAIATVDSDGVQGAYSETISVSI